MAPKAGARLTLEIAESRHRGKAGVRIVGYGIVGGTYGSQWSRFIPTELRIMEATPSDMARLLLTGLYGLDYDL